MTSAPLPVETSIWLDNALAITPARTWFMHDGAEIELLTWGRIGAPGLLFVPGNAASADWWLWIAPFFETTHRVAALSLSGMGGSQHRDDYSLSGYAGEIARAIEVGGLLKSDEPPLIVAHSFGGMPATLFAALHPDKIGELILVDSFVIPVRRASSGRTAMPTYATREEAKARFRLMPPQGTCDPRLVELLADQAITATPEGTWTWRFDPSIWDKLDLTGVADNLGRISCAATFLWGELSSLSDQKQRAAMREQAPHAAEIEIPRAAHHVMVDQPLALVTALRTIIAAAKRNARRLARS